jgi:trimeric autotransporter adhesin
MKNLRHLFATFLVFATLTGLMAGQQPAMSAASAVVPRLVNFSGKAVDAQGKPVNGIAGVTFAIYKDQDGGSPLWMETQNIRPDAKGNYSAQLGATKGEGIPLDLFTTGEARWLGVRVNGGEEQPRVLLLSVPYALKAADAETIGGLPPSAFVLAAPVAGGNLAAMSSAQAKSGVSSALSGTGTADFLPLWLDGAGTLGNSILFQSGTGATAKIGIGTTTPAQTLDVKGNVILRGSVVSQGILALPTTGAATASAGKNSQPETIAASSFSSSSKTAVQQQFQWQAEPAANNTTAPSATLNLLFGQNAAKPSETGLKINAKGQITFAPGQTFPGGGGSGTVTSVGLSAPSSDFTVSGSPVTSSGTLALNWTTAPTSSDVANAIVKRDSAGSFSAGRINGNGTGDFGVVGETDTVVGVGGVANSGYGGQFSANTGLGLFGESASGVAIEAFSSSNEGLISFSGTTAGILGIAEGTQPTSTGFGPDGVVGEAGASVGTGVVAINTNANGDAFLAINQGSSSGPAALFVGNVTVAGNLSKSGGSFQIDHPLDPANKYLYHSFVESPDMMNIYNGVVTLNANGQALVNLPDWFESLNQDFRYQLTAIGAPGPNLHIAEKVKNNSFKIAGGQPGMEVSWQVTGIRHDAWANAHRIPVEIAKPTNERGTYIHPELFGAPKEKSVAAVHHPSLNHLPTISAVKPLKHQ